MAQVIIERPRSYRGSYARRAPGYPRTKLAPKKSEWDAAPDREPVGGARYRERFLNENLAPLRRFLHANVGRPWNLVYSELCAELAVSSAVQKHVRDHLADYVTMVTWKTQEGIVGVRRGGPESVESRLRDRFYVSPGGILRRAPLKKRSARPPDPTVRRLDDARELRRIQDVWYEITYAPATVVPTWDCVLRRLVRGVRCAATKRQLGRRELEALGLHR